MEKNSRVCRRFFHLYVYPSFFPGHPRRMEISEEKNPRDPKKKPTKSEQCRFLKHLLYQSQNKKTKKKRTPPQKPLKIHDRNTKNGSEPIGQQQTGKETKIKGLKPTTGLQNAACVSIGAPACQNESWIIFKRGILTRKTPRDPKKKPTKSEKSRF